MSNPNTTARQPACDKDRRNDPFGHSSLPNYTTQSDCVRAIGAVAQRLLSTRGDPDGTYVGGVLLNWLENGGNLAHLFGVSARRGSHDTQSAIWHKLNSHIDESEER